MVIISRLAIVKLSCKPSKKYKFLLRLLFFYTHSNKFFIFKTILIETFCKTCETLQYYQLQSNEAIADRCIYFDTDLPTHINLSKLILNLKGATLYTQFQASKTKNKLKFPRTRISQKHYFNE